MATIVSGAAFGAALTASGMYLPTVIQGQFRWDNYHMMQTFLTATAASALVRVAADRLDYAHFGPRSFAPTIWLDLSGNVVGGLALGGGMALAGACPGTVLAQAALALPSGYYALAGGLAGGLVWASTLRPSIRARSSSSSSSKPSCTATRDLPTLLGLSPAVVLVLFEGVAAAAVYFLANHFGPGPDAILSPFVGGLLIAAAQLTSIVLRKTMLGVSTVYEDFGDWLLWSTNSNNKKPTTSALQFALGVAAGARGVAALWPALAAPLAAAKNPALVSPAAAVAGGFVMAIGARMGGGCTSGHGLSGISLFSTSSLLTMGAAFVGGTIVSLLKSHFA